MHDTNKENVQHRPSMVFYLDCPRPDFDIRTRVEREWGVVVVSADESHNSDVYNLTQHWNTKYLNIPLPRWQHRPSTLAHQEAQKLKVSNMVVVSGARCPYKSLHSSKLYNKRDNRISGPHCALIDCFELVQHIIINQLSSIIYKACFSSLV
jgi:hypothetical protein